MTLIQGLAAHAAGRSSCISVMTPASSASTKSKSPSPTAAFATAISTSSPTIGASASIHLFPATRSSAPWRLLAVKSRSLEVGQRVGLGWQSNSCGQCEWCMKGQENLCPFSEGTCVHRHGGYADRVRANARFVVPIPGALPSEQTAPLLCGGITVYNPMRINGINPSSRVGVVGIGGLGHLAIQFARVFGAEVTAFSTSLAKEEEARALGAHHFVNSRETKAMKEVAGALDFVLTTVNADQDWSAYLQTLRPNGTLWFVGVPPSPVSVHAFPLISGLRTIGGSPVGSPARLREMLDVAARHGVKATTELFPMAKANEAIEKVKKGKVRYRAVLAN